MELETCVTALERRQNVCYQWNFVRGLKGRMRRKAHWFPDRFDITRLDSIRTVREFDERYTAPHFGFRDASDYYYRASAMRVIDRISVPGLIITAEDDPFVPSPPFREPAVTSNPFLEVRVMRYGGHCAFVADPHNGGDGYWAEERILEFVRRHATNRVPPSAASRTPDPAPALRA